VTAQGLTLVADGLPEMGGARRFDKALRRERGW